MAPISPCLQTEGEQVGRAEGEQISGWGQQDRLMHMHHASDAQSLQDEVCFADADQQQATVRISRCPSTGCAIT
jgi:hypothetical protein